MRWYICYIFFISSIFQVSEKEIKEMFSVADHDNNGFIGYKEFMVIKSLEFIL